MKFRFFIAINPDTGLMPIFMLFAYIYIEIE